MPFNQLKLHPEILRAIRAVGYSEPTPIQRRAIPPILEGSDLIGAAQTGTGKTAAFVLPILTRLLTHRGPNALRALILTPTRELAAQVAANGRTYARYSGLRVAAVFGGVPIPPQERLLRHEGVDVLIATPGRLLDLHGRQSVSLDDVEILVLDEADRMVDMGFAPDLRRILRLLPEDRQTLMFSATMPAELNAVAREALADPVRVDLAPPSRPAAGITQAIYPVPRNLKIDLLDEILSTIDLHSVIVFARTKRGADRVGRQLQRRGHPTAVLHGDRTQGQRDRALQDLKRGRVQILVATDIASRGIDVRGISHVINFDVPHTPEDYVHRIGRTGRVDAVGDAFTLMSVEEKPDVAAIERFLGHSIPRVMLSDFDYHMRPSEMKQAITEDRPRGGAHHGGRDRAPHGGHGRGNGGRASSHAPPHSAPPAAAPAHGRKPQRAKLTDRRGRGRM